MIFRHDARADLVRHENRRTVLLLCSFEQEADFLTYKFIICRRVADILQGAQQIADVERQAVEEDHIVRPSCLLNGKMRVLGRFPCMPVLGAPLTVQFDAKCHLLVIDARRRNVGNLLSETRRVLLGKTALAASCTARDEDDLTHASSSSPCSLGKPQRKPQPPQGSLQSAGADKSREPPPWHSLPHSARRSSCA